MEHFDRYTSLSDERTLELLAYIRSCGGECSTVELRKVVPNYPTLKERLDWMAEDGLIDSSRVYAPVKKTTVSVTDLGRKVISALSFGYGSISMRYADPVMRCLSRGGKVHYADLLKNVSNQRALEKLLSALESDGLITRGVETESYRAKFALATEEGVKVGKARITVDFAETSDFNPCSKTVDIKIVPAATAGFTAANQPTGIRLTWKEVAGANAYFIFRDGTQIAAVRDGSVVTYTDKKANTNGTKYVYKIIASASVTGRSTHSKSVTAYRVDRPAISSLTNSGANKMTVKWGKNAKATGYQVQYCPDKTFKTGNKSVTVSGASTVSKEISGLVKGKTYYVRIRTFKTVGSTKYFSGWSPVNSVKITK